MTGPFPFRKLQAESHGFKRQEDIGKNDGGIKRKTVNGLQRDLCGQFRRLTKPAWSVSPAENDIRPCSDQPGA